MSSDLISVEKTFNLTPTIFCFRLKRLREVVPKLDVDYKLSKFETLQMAQTYIQAMCEMLDKGTDENSYTLFESSGENNNCRKTMDKNEV